MPHMNTRRRTPNDNNAAAGERTHALATQHACARVHLAVRVREGEEPHEETSCRHPRNLEQFKNQNSKQPQYREFFSGDQQQHTEAETLYFIACAIITERRKLRRGKLHQVRESTSLSTFDVCVTNHLTTNFSSD